MPQNSPRAARLTQLDAELAQNPDAIEPRYMRASLMREAGRTEDAKRDYLALLQRAPTHYGALNDFGTMLLATGYRDAARTVFEQAVRHHPERPDGRVNLANLLFKLDDFAAARAHFEAALCVDPDHVHAHRGLANVLAELGDDDDAREHRHRGFRGHALTTLPYYGDGPPVRVLLLVSALGGNIPTAALLDERIFLTHVLAAEYAAEYMGGQTALPPHDIVFNSIGDADLCRHALADAEAILLRTTRPVINLPSVVRASGRLDNAQRLRDLPDVVVPRIARVARDRLATPQGAADLTALGFAFPLLLRAPGFHTGRHFVRVDDARDLASAACALPSADILAIEPLDVRGADGKFRKYRVMIVDRRLYPLHVAVSSHWKVHYFTADMAGDRSGDRSGDLADATDHRGEDEAFLANPAVLGMRAIAALEWIAATLGLDYGGIDFALGPAGEVLFFEANAAMVVTPPTDDPKWAYRRPGVDRIIAAVRTMLIGRARAR